MSVEALALAGIVEDGSPKVAYQQGIDRNDFEVHLDEWDWIENQFENRKKINRRRFTERFPDFDFMPPRENLVDLLDELKTERAFSKVYSLIETVSETLLPENAIQQADYMREILAEVVRHYSPHSDIDLKDHSRHIEVIKQHRRLAKAGQPVGMPTYIPSIDYHWDGFIPGRLIGCLGRPGEGKSSVIAWIAWIAIKTGYRIGIFSPEMNEFEHRCRVHTYASADPEVQEALGLTQSFRNRDLMRGTNFSMKQYRKFMEYFESLPGYAQLFTKVYRKTPLTISYVGSKIDDLGLNGVIADPLSKLSTGARRSDNPVWDDYEKVGQFQELAEEHNIFCFATNWSNRNQGKKNQDAPDLDESFGSDALAKESDHIIGVKYDAEDRELILKCTKSRFGLNKFRVHVDFHPNTGHWEEVNIPYEVVEYRLRQNGSMINNGNQRFNGRGPKEEVQKAIGKVVKAKPSKVTKIKSKKAVKNVRVARKAVAA